MKRLLVSGLLGTLVFLCPELCAVEGFPPYVSLPAGVNPPAPGSLTVEEFAEAEFPLAEGKSVTKQGKHYRSYVTLPGGANPGAAATWKAWQPMLSQQGWKAAGSDGGATYTLRRTSGTLESWLRVALADYNDPLLELIEIKGRETGLVLPKPGAQPEKPSDREDFPYLSHYPGTSLVQTVHHAEPLDVSVPGVDPEPVLAGNGYTVKRYSAPSTLSRLEFVKSYREALAKAGWTVKGVAPGTAEAEQAVVASYTRDGRNISATLTRFDPGSDRGIDIAVADLGTEDWARSLDKDCRLPLYGVHFDFGKATLKSESEPVLQKVLALLKAQPSLSVEVQGHTDNVGSDADNQKLSEARAKAVATWLTSHGVAAGRLSSQGFGRKSPVASNDDASGRARNRRVELKKQGCAK